MHAPLELNRQLQLQLQSINNQINRVIFGLQTTAIQEDPPMKRSWKKVIDTESKWLGSEDKGEWLKDMRGNLAMVATVIVTTTFQVGLNPLGGVVQNDER